jgi:hypothetical protein
MGKALTVVLTLAWVLAPTRAEAGTVIVIEKGMEAKAVVGDVVRVRGSVPAGQGTVTVKVSGPGKLVVTNTVRTFVNGMPLIGTDVTEFEVKAEKKGKVTISVTVDNTLTGMKETTDYVIEVG